MGGRHRAYGGVPLGHEHPLKRGRNGGRFKHMAGRKVGGSQPHPEGVNDEIAGTPFGGTQPHPEGVNDAPMQFGGPQNADAASGGAGGDGDADDGMGGMALGGM